MGEWIDVYTDDVLPCSENWNRYVGVHSDNNNILWVPFAEKALARLYGSYPQISGNESEVFRLLTGGLVEDIKISDVKKGGDYQSSDKLFERVDKALMSGSTVLTNIPQGTEESKLKGLIAYHAYSVTGALKIKRKKQVTKLLRIRNPWGRKETTGRINDGEWKGRWSYTSTEWKEVDEALRTQHNVHINKGGECWVCMEDFCKLFGQLYIGDRIPHFDRDGFRKEDGLDKVINILGEWHGVTAAGSGGKKRMRNPRFILTIPGQHDTKSVAVLIEITRQFENPADSNDDKDSFIGVIDIYKIEKEDVRGNRSWICLNKQTVEKSYIGCRTSTYLCKLSPGNHLLVPYYYDNHVKPPVSKSFCIRIFTKVNSTCRSQTENPVMFVRKAENCLEYRNQRYTLGKVDIMFGEWVKKLTAGGQKYYDSFGKNPHFDLSVAGNVPQPVLISLLQETVAPIHAIGCYVTNITEGVSFHLSVGSHYNNAEVKTFDGNTHPFMLHIEASGYYMLPPGQYRIRVFADNPKDEKKFALVIGTKEQLITEPK